MNDEIWTFKELARHWKTSVSTLRRQSELPVNHKEHLRTMLVGKQKRVHITEILRHETPAIAIPLEEHKPQRVKNSALAKTREAIRRANLEKLAAAS